MRELDFDAALERIRGLVWRTPLIPVSAPNADRVGHSVPAARQSDAWLKLESLQRTGSFKIRGAANRLLGLTPAERARGVVAVSSGNHGRAVAEVARILGIRATICVPDWADPSKLRSIRAAGARLIRAGPSYDEADERAAGLAVAEGLTRVHPFDDADVIEGQGTVGLELAEQLPGLGEVIVPLSGGGLVAGIGLALKPRGVRVVAVSAQRASVMLKSLEAGRPLRIPDEETIASALSGGIGDDNRLTLQLVQEVVDEHIIVEEDAIRAAVRSAFRDHHLVVEGGGAVGLAALASGYRPRGRAAVIVSGGNIDAPALAAVAG
ncbi:MAG: threonine/serine dehydratase [Gemmatimonadota bacterium]|nr:threonine/serine dehydratase [Gemmatimonadota bacterium]